MSFENFDQYFAEEPKVPVRFFKEVDGLGRLVGNDDSIRIKADAIIDLPFWIAKRLAKRLIVEIQRPKFLDDQIINALIANPIDVNLRIICPQFYTFATKYAELVEDVKFAESLRLILLTSKLARNVEIWDRAKRFAEDHNELFEKLDDDEQACKKDIKELIIKVFSGF